MQTKTAHFAPMTKYVLVAFTLAMVFLCATPSNAQAQIVLCPGYTLTVDDAHSNVPINFIINMQGPGGLGYSRPVYSFNSSSIYPYTETYGSDTFLNIDIDGTIYTADGLWHNIGHGKEPITGCWRVRITRDANGCITIEFKYVNI